MTVVKACSKPADQIPTHSKLVRVLIGISKLFEDAGSLLLTDIASLTSAANEDRWVGTVKNE